MSAVSIWSKDSLPLIVMDVLHEKRVCQYQTADRYLLDWCVAFLDGVIDSPTAVADLANLLIVLITYLLLGWSELCDVSVVTLLN